MDADNKNCYDVLEISSNAAPQEIESAYVRAKNAYSGDSVALYSLMTKDECDAVLEQIEEAYSVIGFPEKRREYDRLRGFNQSGFAQNYSIEPLHGKSASENLTKDSVQYEDYGSSLIEAKVSKISAQKKLPNYLHRLVSITHWLVHSLSDPLYLIPYFITHLK